MAAHSFNRVLYFQDRLSNYYLTVKVLGPMLSITFLKVLEINIMFVDYRKDEKW